MYINSVKGIHPMTTEFADFVATQDSQPNSTQRPQIYADVV